MNAFLVSLLGTAPVSAIGTAIYLWWRRTTITERGRHRSLCIVLWTLIGLGALYFGLVAFAWAATPEPMRLVKRGFLWLVSVAYVWIEMRGGRRRVPEKP
jgi:hypothetical protein